MVAGGCSAAPELQRRATAIVTVARVICRPLYHFFIALQIRSSTIGRLQQSVRVEMAAIFAKDHLN
jgi:hypothetical protein